jgi:hypothetical protein
MMYTARKKINDKGVEPSAVHAPSSALPRRPAGRLHHGQRRQVPRGHRIQRMGVCPPSAHKTLRGLHSLFLIFLMPTRRSCLTLLDIDSCSKASVWQCCCSRVATSGAFSSSGRSGGGGSMACCHDGRLPATSPVAAGAVCIVRLPFFFL